MRPRRLHHLLAGRALRRRADALAAGGTLLWPRAAGRLAHPDASFDVVVALDLLEALDWRDRPAALHELARVARGHLLVATRLPAMDVIVPLRAWGPVRCRIVGRPRWTRSYRAVVVAEMAASISASSSPASAS